MFISLKVFLIILIYNKKKVLSFFGKDKIRNFSSIFFFGLVKWVEVGMVLNEIVRDSAKGKKENRNG